MIWAERKVATLFIQTFDNMGALGPIRWVGSWGLIVYHDLLGTLS